MNTTDMITENILQNHEDIADITIENTSNIVSENILEDHGENIDPSIVLTLCTIAIPALAALCCSACCKNERDVLELITFGSLLVAVVIFFIYASYLQQRDQMDYHGLVRVIDVQYKTEMYHVEDKAERTHWIVPQLTLDWGYDWACPEHPDTTTSEPKQCQPSLSDAQCATKVCSTRPTGGFFDGGWENCSTILYEGALNAAKVCIQQQSGCDQSAMDENLPFNPLVGPSQDRQKWPSLMAYGNCDTCDVQMWVASTDTFPVLRNAGFAFLALGSLLLVFLVVVRNRKKAQAGLSESAGSAPVKSPPPPPPTFDA